MGHGQRRGGRRRASRSRSRAESAGRAPRARRLLPRRRGADRSLEQRLGYRPRRARTRAPRAHALADDLVPRAARAPDLGPAASRWRLGPRGARRRDLRRSRDGRRCSPSSRSRSWRSRSSNASLARLLPPRTLPKLDFAKGLPDDARTLVVIPTLLGRAEDVDGDDPADRAPLPVESRSAASVRAPHRRRRREDDAGPTPTLLDERRARDRGAQREARHGRRSVRFTSCTASRAGIRPRSASWAGSASAASSRSSIACSAATTDDELRAPRRRSRTGSSGSASSSRSTATPSFRWGARIGWSGSSRTR